MEKMKRYLSAMVVCLMALFLTACVQRSDLVDSESTLNEPVAFDGITEITISLSEEESDMSYDFAELSNVELINADTDSMNAEQLAVLYQQARYCQAMTTADIEEMRSLTSENMTFTHMSGKQQTREEYFKDITNGSLRYFTIGIESPTVEVNGSTATLTCTSVLNANAYGARGTYRMSGTHYYEKSGENWIAVNHPE